jgi:predicted transporter
MSAVVSLLTAGIFGGTALLALKSGVGCGLSGLRTREMLCFASVYALAALIMGAIAGGFPLNVTEQVIGLGLLMHLIIGLALIYFGIKTKKRWLSDRKDISRRTFLLMSLPCPACLAATFLACLIFTDTTGMSGVAAGAVVGGVFFVGIAGGGTGTSWITTKTGMKNPSTLGNVMLFLGLFYLLCLLVVPAYLQAQDAPVFTTATTDPTSMLLALTLMAALILLGALVDRVRRTTHHGGK